jgi:hypothetical protein
LEDEFCWKFLQTIQPNIEKKKEELRAELAETRGEWMETLQNEAKEHEREIQRYSTNAQESRSSTKDRYESRLNSRNGKPRNFGRN